MARSSLQSIDKRRYAGIFGKLAELPFNEEDEQSEEEESERSLSDDDESIVIEFDATHDLSPKTVNDVSKELEMLEFSYGDFTMELCESDLTREHFDALRRTTLECNKDVGKILWRRVQVKFQAANSFRESIESGTARRNTAQEIPSRDMVEASDVVPRRSSNDEIGVTWSAGFAPSLGQRKQGTRRTNMRSHGSSLASRSVPSLNMSVRRSVLTSTDLASLSCELLDLEMDTKVKDWMISLRDLDPRHQILQFFNHLALEGVDSYASCGRANRRSFMAKIPKVLRGFIKSGIFSVWRPTSSDAIRKMITGDGTGKGLDIKGKSAKRGKFSGFVPYLQIHDNEHKKKVGAMRPNHRVRVFYPNEESRNTAATVLNMIANPMVARATLADEQIKKEGMRRSRMAGMMTMTKEMSECLANVNRCLMEDPTVYNIDDYIESQGSYGLDIPEKLFWEGYVMANDINVEKGSEHETGRPSMPEFQQMNVDTMRGWSKKGCKDDPRPVLWHGECGRLGEPPPEHFDPLSPLGLLIAYEEDGKVVPVVSDFDCFLLGTRGVKYHEPLGDQELSMLSMCVNEIEGILETLEEGGSWTQRWLGVKKKHLGDANFSREMPKFGYADPRSYKIMTGAVHRMKSNGAVRHGPECFNYGFPQELDDQYLVICDTFHGVPWRYTNPSGLIDILCARIESGFTFPLNPKWVLCDPGWRMVYEKLMASTKPNVQDSMNIWYPDYIRTRIDQISTKFPTGFVDKNKDERQDFSSGVATDLAVMELTKYKNKMEAKQKFKNAFSRGTVSKTIRASVLKAIDFDALAEVADEDDDCPITNGAIM